MLFSNSMLPEHCRSLFLGDLSCFCQEADVYRFFQPFGDIEEIRIKRNHDGIGLGYGFITFARRDSAEQALRKDGDVLVGRPLRVSWATARGAGNFYPENIKSDFPVQIRKPKGTLKNGPPESAQIHFSFISKQTQRVITEASIREVFSHFGEVKDVTIKKTTSLPRTGQQTGYGFLDYPLTDEGIQSAIKASRIVKQVHIYDVLYDCCLTWDLEEIIARRKLQSNDVNYNGSSPTSSSVYSNQLQSESSENYSILQPTVSSNSLLSDSSNSFHGRSFSDNSSNTVQASSAHMTGHYFGLPMNTSHYDSPYVPDRRYRSPSFPPQQQQQQFPVTRGMNIQHPAESFHVKTDMKFSSYHQTMPFHTYSSPASSSSATISIPYQGASYPQPY